MLDVLGKYLIIRIFLIYKQYLQEKMHSGLLRKRDLSQLEDKKRAEQ